MLASFSAEMDKLLGRPATWMLALLWSGIAILFGYLIPYLIYANPGGDVVAGQQRELLATVLPRELIANALSGFPLFGGAMAVLLGVLATGSEYSWGTLKTVLTQRPDRLGVLTGKLLALALILCAFVLIVFVFGALCSYAIAQIEDAPATWPPLWNLVRALGAGWLILAVWTALGALLATAFRSTALPIGLGLIYVLVFEFFIGGFAGQSKIIAGIAKALPGPNAGSLVAALAPTSLEGGTPGLVLVAGPVQATVVLMAYAAGFVLLSLLLFVRRDTMT